MKETLHTKAYDWILNKILQENCPPGTPMKEEKLAEEIGISATPVREALRQLEREGWLETIPYRGCFLKQYTAIEIEELTILRESVEVASVPQFIKSADQEDLAHLDDNIRKSEKLLAKISKHEIPEGQCDYLKSELDAEFHHAIVVGTHCPRIIKLAAMWNQQLHHYAFRSLQQENNEDSTQNDDNYHYVINQHKAILLALDLGWEKAAQELLRAHIAGSYMALKGISPHAKREQQTH